MAVIDNFKRYQNGLSINHIFPNMNGYCACGCGLKLTGRKKRWATPECQDYAVRQFLVIKGDTDLIRQEVFERDNGVCCSCGSKSEKWHADHILPVHKGGGACTLDNFNTLCENCHKEKTQKEMESHRIAMSLQASFI